MNPYAAFLGNRDPLQVIEETFERLRAVFENLGKEGADRALAPGKWTAREILCHLADTEVVFAFRLRQALAEPHHVIQPFDQDKWAANYREAAVEEAMQCFTAVRNWNVILLRSVEPDTLGKPVTHPERGTMTFRTLIETMAGHDRNHLAQLETIAGRRPS